MIYVITFIPDENLLQKILYGYDLFFIVNDFLDNCISNDGISILNFDNIDDVPMTHYLSSDIDNERDSATFKRGFIRNFENIGYYIRENFYKTHTLQIPSKTRNEIDIIVNDDKHFKQFIRNFKLRQII